MKKKAIGILAVVIVVVLIILIAGELTGNKEIKIEDFTEPPIETETEAETKVIYEGDGNKVSVIPKDYVNRLLSEKAAGIETENTAGEFIAYMDACIQSGRVEELAGRLNEEKLYGRTGHRVNKGDFAGSLRSMKAEHPSGKLIYRTATVFDLNDEFVPDVLISASFAEPKEGVELEYDFESGIPFYVYAYYGENGEITFFLDGMDKGKFGGV